MPLNRKAQEDRRDDPGVSGLRHGCQCAEDEVGEFAYRQFTPDAWTAYVSDDKQDWWWDLAYANALPSAIDRDLPVILRMEGAEIEVNHERMLLIWTGAQRRTQDVLSVRLQALEYARITEGPHQGERLLEVRARPLGPPAEFPRSGWVFSKMSVARKHHAQLEVLYGYLCDLAWQRHGRDLQIRFEDARPPEPGRVAQLSEPEPAVALPLVEVGTRNGSIADHGSPSAENSSHAPEKSAPAAAPALEATSPTAHPDPSAPANGETALRSREPRPADQGRILRLNVRLAPDHSDWLSFAVLSGTDSLLSIEHTPPVAVDPPAEVTSRGI